MVGVPWLSHSGVCPIQTWMNKQQKHANASNTGTAIPVMREAAAIPGTACS